MSNILIKGNPFSRSKTLKQGSNVGPILAPRRMSQTSSISSSNSYYSMSEDEEEMTFNQEEHLDQVNDFITVLPAVLKNSSVKNYNMLASKRKESFKWLK